MSPLVTLRLTSTALFTIAGGCREAPQPPAPQAAIHDLQRDTSGVIAISNVTVIDPDADAPRPNMTVIVRDGRIAAVGADDTTTVPDGARRVSADGRFLIPGLWDAHAHLSYPGECSLPLMIAHGVTSVRDLGGPPVEGVAWRRDIVEGRRVGPRLFLAGLNIESADWLEGVERMIAESAGDSSDQRLRRLWERSPRFKVGGPGDARRAVDTARQLGMDALKFRNLGGASFQAALSEARRLGLPVAGHAPKEVSLADAAEAGLRSLEHGANLAPAATLPPDERRKQYERIARSGMFVTPTLVSDIMWSPDSLVLAALADTSRGLSGGQAEMWRDMIRDRRSWSQPVPRHVHDSSAAVEIAWVREAHRAGVPLLAGTDLGTLLTYPGSSVHEELALFVERVGLTPREALRTATVLPAKFFGLEKEIGTIAVGKRADLVLLRANPLSDIRNVAQVDGVVAAGRYFAPGDVSALKGCRVPVR